jgi:uncharacterized CHY-type Zn-finger protein
MATAITLRCTACSHRLTVGQLSDAPDCPRCSSPMAIVYAVRKP